MIALLLRYWKPALYAGVVIGALTASFVAGHRAGSRAWESKYLRSEAQHETDRADANREARKVLEEAVLRERAEQRRIEDEASAATLAAEERAKGLAASLRKTQARLAAAIKENPECAAQASQRLACPVSWLPAAHP